MVVPFVDERNADRSPGQLARCEESAETTANNNSAQIFFLSDFPFRVLCSQNDDQATSKIFPTPPFSAAA